MSHRGVAAVVVGTLCALVWTSSALAQPDAAEVAADLDRTGFYVEAGSGDRADGVDDAAADLARQGLHPGLVVLAEEPPGGSTAFATQVFDELIADDSEVRTVVVVSPDDVGAESDEHTAETLDAALDASIDEFRSSPAEGFTAFYAELGEEAAAGNEDGGGDGGGRTILIVLLIIALALAALTGLWWWRGRKKAAATDKAALEEARHELKAQLSVVAERILATEARVAAGSDAAQQRFTEASAAYSATLDAIDRATSPAELRELSNRLDRARWQIDAVEAELDGRPIPPEPTAERQAACFFDPNHPSATEEAELRSPAGTRTVGVCAACAEKLRRGEQPQPREIQVGNERVPAPQAPREMGGGGLGGLLKGGLFEIVLGGLAAGASSFDWGRHDPPAPRRRGRPAGQWGSVVTDPWGVGPSGGRRRRRAEPAPAPRPSPEPQPDAPRRGPRVRRGRRL